MTDSFSVEQGVYGERLVLHSEWKNEFVDYMLANNIGELNVNYARGFSGQNLNFLQQLPFLTGLLLIVYNIADISVIHNLHRLKALNMGCRDITPLDFSAFPDLKDCGLDWRPKSDSIFQCRTLERLFINQYSYKHTDKFEELTSLSSLFFSGGPLGDLTGLQRLQNLETMGLYHLRSLSSLHGIENLAHLEELDIDTCRKLTSINEIQNLKRLRRLTLANCNDILSLRPIKELTSLERLYFYESTNINDGDLSFLTHLPNLTDVRFMNRKHYTNRCEEFPPFNTDSPLRGKALVEALRKGTLL